MVAPNYADICDAQVELNTRSVSLSWAAGYIEGCGGFSGPNTRLKMGPMVHAPVVNSSAARELLMLFPGSRVQPNTMPPLWAVTGDPAIVAMQQLLPYLRISAHAVAVFL